MKEKMIICHTNNNKYSCQNIIKLYKDTIYLFVYLFINILKLNFRLSKRIYDEVG